MLFLSTPTCPRRSLHVLFQERSAQVSLHMNPTDFLAQCRVARASKRYHSLATLAQAAITAHPCNLEAWSNLAVACYALHRYQNAIQATLTALSISSTPDKRNKLRVLLCCSQLLSRLRNSHNPSPTSRLTSGWYKDRLQDLFDSGQLRAYPTIAQMKKDPSIASATLEDCAIVLRQSGKYDSGWEDIETRDGGSRDIPPTLLDGFPLDQTTGGYIYLKDRVTSLGCDCYDDGLAPCSECRDAYYDLPIPAYHFPRLPIALPQQVQVLGGPLVSVHAANGLVPEHIRETLSEELTRLGLRRPDSPVPKYHNIIDPNIAAVDGLWVPTEFDVEQLPAKAVLDILESAIRRHSSCPTVPFEILDRIYHQSGAPTYGRCVMRSTIPDLDPHRYSSLYVAIEQVMNAALPLLANLRLPALLLPGPLQVVVKAQRVVLDADDSYEGVWHDDGLREHVVAIVLYYYGMSPSLVGGSMEFASKRRMKLYTGDDWGNYFDARGVRSAIGEMCRCVVPVAEGTMLVFSNYAAVHRVLPMLAKGEAGSREFLAFFIIDQKHPLAIPDILGPRKERITRRAAMLREQLQVRGHFGMDDSEVCATGNGTLSDLAWISSGELFPAQAGVFSSHYGEADAALAIVSRLNMTPPVIGRGSSFLTSMDLPTVQFNPASSWMLHIVNNESKTQVFVDTISMYYTSVIPENGIRAVQTFENKDWLKQGFWTYGDNLRKKIMAKSQRCSNSHEEE